MCRDSGYYVLKSSDDDDWTKPKLEYKLGPSMNAQIVEYLRTSSRTAGFKVTLSGGVKGAGADVGLAEANWWDCGQVTFVEGLPDLGAGLGEAGEAGEGGHEGGVEAEEPDIVDDATPKVQESASAASISGGVAFFTVVAALF